MKPTRVMADPYARERGWVGRNTWLMSSDWTRPRMILLVRQGRVYLALFNKKGDRAGSRAVARLPGDVHEVDPPSDRPMPRSLS